MPTRPVPDRRMPPTQCLARTGCSPDGGGDGGQQCCATGDGGSSCPPPESSSSFSAFPVRYANGEIRLIVQDLASDGFGTPWGHTRSFSNRLTAQDQGVNGNGWFIKEMPQIVQVSADSANWICLIGTIQEALWFKWDAGQSKWVPEFYVQDSLVENANNQEFIHTDTLGRMTKFYDFSTGQGARAGQFKSFTDRSGNSTVATYNTSDQLISFVQSSGSKSTGYYYDYIPTGLNAGKLQHVTLRVDGATEAANIRRAKYDYHDGSDSFGLAGDLNPDISYPS